MENIDLMLKRRGSRVPAGQSAAVLVAATEVIQAVVAAPVVVVGVAEDGACGVMVLDVLVMTIILATNHSHISNI